MQKAEENLLKLIEAVKPFLQPAFSELLGGNVEGDDSPIYARGSAMLRIGDFRNIQEVYKEITK